MKKTLLFQAIPLVSLTFSSCVEEPKTNITPNIIYIYADDLGVGDIGCYGQKYIRTPNIDRLAEEGIRFTQHYTGAPISAPARSCLITGKHSGNSYIRNNYELPDTSDFKTGQLPLPEATFTIAKLLKNKNYSTAAIGKWGLGSIKSTGNPNKQGFDLFYGYADQVHAHNHYPTFLWRNGEQEFLDNDVVSVHPRYGKDEQFDIKEEYKKYMGNKYSLDLLTNEAIRFIEDNKKNPAYKETEVRGMYQVEHDELFASIRANKPMNDGEWMTRSNMLALAGRMAAYSGQTITFDQALNSSGVLFGDSLTLDSKYDISIAIPGITEFK